MKHALPTEGRLVEGRSFGEENFDELKCAENKVGMILGGKDG